MPNYEYECDRCQKQGEYFAPMSQSGSPPDCECGAKTKRVILSAPMGYVHFPAAGGQAYVSTVSGKYIDSKRKREDDLKRHGCRTYEGFEQEKKEADRRTAHEEKKADQKLDATVREAFHQLPPEKRKVLEQT